MAQLKADSTVGGKLIATVDDVNAAVQGLDIKQSVKAATTANITLSGTQTIDGVALSVGDRVLVKNQTNAAENGIYVVQSGTWTRATDANDGTKLKRGAFVFVEQGTTNADSGWVLTTDGSVTVGTTAINWTQFSGAGQIVAGTGLQKSGNTLSLTNTGVTAGTYTKVTVDAQGRVTSGTTLSSSDIPNLDWSKITSGKPTTLAGYGITDGVNTSDVVTTATANKILKLDSNAKLPASITGDADTVDGKHASDLVQKAGDALTGGLTGKYFIAGGYKTADPGSSTGQWAKLLSVNITGQYGYYSGIIAFNGGNNGSGNSVTGFIDFRVKQQAALGSAPYIELYLYSHKNITASAIVAVTTQNDAAATVVELYIKGIYTYEPIFFTPLLVTSTISSITYNDSAAWNASLPSGTQTVASYLNVTGNQLVSTVATGTAPLSVNSTTTVTSLSADMVDGYHASSFALLASSNTFKPSSDSTTAFQVQKSDASVVLDVDTTNKRVGILTSSPDQPLTVSGNIKTTGQLISSVATGTAPLSVSSTTTVTNLSADMVDGYHAGNASGNIPISNGTVNTNLNADKVDGYDASSFVLVSNLKVKCGTGTFAGNGSEVTIAHNLGATPSAVTVTPNTASNGYVGEWWVRWDATNIYVGNTGSGSSYTFSWIAVYST